MAVAAFIQSNDREEANKLWKAARSDQERYELFRDYLSFAPESLEEFFPDGYRIVLPESIEVLAPFTLFSQTEIVYEL